MLKEGRKRGLQGVATEAGKGSKGEQRLSLAVSVAVLRCYETLPVWLRNQQSMDGCSWKERAHTVATGPNTVMAFS